MILAAVLFLITIISLPQTDCQVCEFEYDGKIIDGYEAFEIFEEACVSYNNPWNNNINTSELNYSG